ncbi:MAG: ribonuclease HII [Bdellovibrionales bacterium]|nr:ribonuclease HII [Bdellovibrionales bacterium]
MNESLFDFDLKPYDLEKQLKKSNYPVVAGVDEAGRGALAGPVVAAAVVLKDTCHKLIGRITDSKKLTSKHREDVYDAILDECSSVGVGVVSAQEIDRLNILKATLKAMVQAVDQLVPRPNICLIDGNVKIPVEIKQLTIIKGDLRVFSISAASIIAKVTRDRMMKALDDDYPVYGLKKHMGYGTKEHYAALYSHGPCAIHRRSFRITV